MITTYRGSVPEIYREQGLNGFFGRLLKKVVSKAIGAIGNFIADKVQGYLSPFGGGIADKIRGFTISLQKSFDLKVGLNGLAIEDNIAGQEEQYITEEEEATLNAWVEEKFKPYIQKLIQDIAAAGKIKSDTGKIKAFNDVLNKIYAAKEYYEQNPLSELSSVAQEGMNTIIHESLGHINFTVVQAVKAAGIIAEPVNVFFPINKYIYKPLFTIAKPIQIGALNYVIPGTQHTEPTNQQPTPTKDNPIPSTGIKPPYKVITNKGIEVIDKKQTFTQVEPLDKGIGDTNKVTTTNTNTPAQSETKNKRLRNTLVVAGITSLAIAVTTIVVRSNSSNSSNSKKN